MGEFLDYAFFNYKHWGVSDTVKKTPVAPPEYDYKASYKLFNQSLKEVIQLSLIHISEPTRPY